MKPRDPKSNRVPAPAPGGSMSAESLFPDASARAGGSAAALGFEEVLWQAADKLRASMDAGEYKHVVLALLFLKCVADDGPTQDQGGGASNPHRHEIGRAARPELIRVPPQARWAAISAAARTRGAGVAIDAAFDAIARANPSLRDVLPSGFARPDLDQARLFELVHLLGGVDLSGSRSGGADVLGRVYEYFLGRFALSEGRLGGQFYTPACVVQLLVEMIQPFKGKVYDPCCGSGGMFVQAERFVEAHKGSVDDLLVFGQESNPTTWRLARMNLALRGISANLGAAHGDTFSHDMHRELKADYILANPPFNMSDWGADRIASDPRWSFGVPPPGNANFAWIQHFVHHLGPRGVAAFVLANGAVSSQQASEARIRRAIVEADLVDAMVALPPQLFYTTAIPACLWFLRRDRHRTARSGHTLFIDARRMGRLIDRRHRELDGGEIDSISRLYHSWISGRGYADVSGFCAVATTEQIRSHEFVLSPGRYVGTETSVGSDGSSDAELRDILAELRSLRSEGLALDEELAKALANLKVIE